MSSVSVCVPTYNRPDLLEEALQSILDQKPTPYEVLVGDDSTNRQTWRLIQRYIEEGAPIRHVWNESSLGLAKNQDKLFREAEGEFIVPIHDDDRLVDGALKKMLDCFQRHSGIVAVFGKQQFIDPSGEVQWDLTNDVNENYHRTGSEEGRISSVLLSAAIQQFPNNGFMIKRDIATEVGYDLPNAGETGDYAFGVQLARTVEGDFYFIDEFTAQYRLTEESLSGGSDSAYRAFKIVMEEIPEEMRRHPYVQDWLRRQSPSAVLKAARKGFVRDGISWYFGPHHRQRILSLGGARRLLTLIGAAIGLKEFL